jgi:hypothetical protein
MIGKRFAAASPLRVDTVEKLDFFNSIGHKPKFKLETRPRNRNPCLF